MLTSSRGWLRFWITLVVFWGLVCGTIGGFVVYDTPKITERIMDCDFTEEVIDGETLPAWRVVERKAPDDGDFKVKDGVVGRWDGSTWRRQDAIARNCKENVLYTHGDKTKILADIQKLIDDGKPEEDIGAFVRKRAGFFFSEDRFNYRAAFVTAGWTFAAWLVPAVGMLLFGLGVRWVYRGFSTNGSAT
jgi:hypothetical protein